MEVREILIANTKTQKRSKITTDATTLGELKQALDDAGVDYSDMTFTEGISKTQLLDDATQLPQNVMFKGQPTNNLVILLTNTKKKIASGAGTRKEAYMAIKDNNLAEDIKEAFGTNYTHVSTADLWDFINDNVEVIPEEETLPEEETEENIEDEDEYGTPDELLEEILTNPLYDVADTIRVHVVMLAKEGVINAGDIWSLKGDLETLYNILNKKEKEQVSQPVSTTDGSISNDDVDDIINDLDL